ncbi:hypothetical protein M9Y10_001927 [Tritrichomonas musculus]|uniref:Kinetochore protein SPC25 n=1 Tax=Tritrichomonas musculus TaxID=1915356 RepID=A0ABR2L9C7_9EUKA
MMDDTNYQHFLQILDEVSNKWRNYEVFYTKVKGLTCISLNNNRFHRKQIINLHKEIEKRDQKIKQLKIERDYLFKLNYLQDQKITFLEKSIRKLTSRENEYKRINSIENPREKVQALINLSDQTYSHLNDKISKYMTIPKISRKLQFSNGTVLTLNKNGTYYFEPDDSFFQNLQYLFLSIICEPNQNEKEKINELLFQFDYTKEDIDFITQKYMSRH